MLSQIVNIPNSMTVLPELLPYSIEMVRSKVPCMLCLLADCSVLQMVESSTGLGWCLNLQGHSTCACHTGIGTCCLRSSLTVRGRVAVQTVTGTVVVNELAVSSDPEDYQWTFTADGSGAAQDNIKASIQGLQAQLQQRLVQFTADVAQAC